MNTGPSATATQLDLMSRLEILREQMSKIERQYEKNKPLVNLVDNMVKLGALYRTGSLQWNAGTMSSKDDLNRLHTNQRNQERLLIAEEQNEWSKYNSRQIELHVSSYIYEPSHPPHTWTERERWGIYQAYDIIEMILKLIAAKSTTTIRTG